MPHVTLVPFQLASTIQLCIADDTSLEKVSERVTLLEGALGQLVDVLKDLKQDVTICHLYVSGVLLLIRLSEMPMQRCIAFYYK